MELGICFHFSDTLSAKKYLIWDWRNQNIRFRENAKIVVYIENGINRNGITVHPRKKKTYGNKIYLGN